MPLFQRMLISICQHIMMLLLYCLTPDAEMYTWEKVSELLPEHNGITLPRSKIITQNVKQWRTRPYICVSSTYLPEHVCAHTYKQILRIVLLCWNSPGRRGSFLYMKSLPKAAFIFCEEKCLLLHKISVRYYSSNILALNPPLWYKAKSAVYLNGGSGP